MKRRKKKRYRSLKRNSGVKFLGFIGIIVGAVICGYATARFVVAPLLGYETEVLKLDFPSKLNTFNSETEPSESETETTAKGNTEKQAAETKPEERNVYVLQFGVFSTKSGAEELINTLKQKDIDTELKEDAGKYKVISKSYPSKEEALKALQALKDKEDIDVFITVMEQ